MIYIVITLAGIFGTMVMTSFSHVMELISGKKFNEAQLINTLIDRSKNFSKVGENHFFGWLIHFIIGVLMAYGLWLYYNEITTIAFSNFGICVGFALGIIGVIGWSLILSFHSDPPQNNWVLFFVQLIIAHIFFAVTVTAFLNCMMN